MKAALSVAFRSPHTRFALFLVLLTGWVHSFFFCKTVVDPAERQYRLDFGASPWIEPPTPSPAGYFRSTLYIPRPVERGWLQVAATDHFLVYVNGKLVNETFFGDERVTGIFDVRNLLIQGKNVIAVYVPRVFAPGSSQLRVRGAYAMAGSAEVEIGTGSQWKASTTPDGVIDSFQWYDTGLEDAGWSAARPVPVSERGSTVQAVTVPPRLFYREAQAQWLDPGNSPALAASFEGRFNLPPDGGDRWLQVASPGAYDVYINGHYAIAQPDAQRTLLPFAQLTAASGPAAITSSQLAGLTDEMQLAAHALLPLQFPAQPAAPTLLSYNVSRWLHPGENRLLIRVRSDNGPPLVLADLSTIVTGAGEWHFATGRNWQVVRGPGLDPVPARELGLNGIAPWGRLPQAQASPTPTPASDLVKYGPWTLWTTLILLGFVAAWLCSGWWYSVITGDSLARALGLDAVAQVPALVYLLTCWLLTFDVRFDMDWCFRPGVCLVALALWVVGRLLLFVAGCLFPPAPPAAPAPPRAPLAARYGKLAAFTAVVLLGFCLRGWNLNGMSLGSDEVTMINNVPGVLQSGYPHSPRGSYNRLLATYEMIPYSLAASSLLFGHTEFAYHLPALLFSTLTIALLGFVGSRMFDWRVGWVAAAIYACYPPSIAWARNAFYPSQEQFLSLATFWFFYEAVRAGPFRRGYVTLAAAGFIVSYLSWEGSGFIVPALFVALLAIRWGDFSWAGDWHLWRCFFMMSVIVVGQLSYRQLTVDGYLAVGYSLSDITAPTLVYKDLLVYNPWYYLRVLFFPEVNFVLSLFIFLGFLFCWRDRAIRYVVVLLFTLELCYSNFLPFYAPRYCYNTETLVILAGVSIFFRFRDRVAGLGGVEAPGLFRFVRWSAAAALTLWLLLATNEFVLKAYRLSADSQNPALFARLGYYKTDHRGAAQYVQRRRMPGDAVIAFMPHMFKFYTNSPADFSINTFLNEKMTYDGIGSSPVFIDKFIGIPLIRSLDELREIQSRYRRLWILVPIRDDNVALSPDTLDYMIRKGTIPYESYREQVFLLQGIPSPMAAGGPAKPQPEQLR